ncbi:TetR/AcrR family transcriptional regulator [Paraburkholderia sp. Cpub6]|uniref:TetR/AcrR family transcriptional regulator n=1 Tax=Paraburkholderia sp. Cpub6 TaxID=2723094 RepID=UPI00161AACB8|nr:TetR/AcrR family transcriptional regulator [Paraburkholderia sp. Cpub6]MBB5457833.1 AcrR family transcriptional regulator [Paraburkholderia sp. Cpub6]
MKRERLTRAQRREQTRECLLEAARKMFVKKGFAATSVEDIAEAAGYTRGAFYSNFGGKPDLLFRLLRRDDDRARTNLLAMMEKGGTPDEMKDRAIAYYGQSIVEHDCFPLWVEAQLLACRDTPFRERINAFRQEKLEQISAHICMLSERNGRPLPLQAEALAVGLVSLCEGVQFFRMCSPQTVSDKVLQTVLAGFFSCVLSRQPEETVYDNRRPDVPMGAP